MTTFLANENMPGDVVAAARGAGYDVAWMAERSPGADDAAVLAIAQAEGRVLATFDKDFGELVFRQGKAASCGIILFRPQLGSPAYLAHFVLAVLSQAVPWEGNFSVAQEGRLRVVALP